MVIREKPQEVCSRRRARGFLTSARGLCLSWNSIHAVGMLTFGSSFLHVSFSVLHFPISTPTLPPIFSNRFLIPQDSDCFVSFHLPAHFCRLPWKRLQRNSVKLWRWGVPDSLLWPSHGSGLKARKHNSKNQKATKIFEADSLDLEDEDPDYITLVFMTQNASTLHVHI